MDEQLIQLSKQARRDWRDKIVIKLAKEEMFKYFRVLMSPQLYQYNTVIQIYLS